MMQNMPKHVALSLPVNISIEILHGRADQITSEDWVYVFFVLDLMDLKAWLPPICTTLFVTGRKQSQISERLI